MTHKREIKGIAVLKSGDKTIKVKVERRALHPRYHKFVRKFKNYLVHDETTAVNVGDTVVAIECRPISKSKAFRVKSKNLGVK